MDPNEAKNIANDFERLKAHATEKIQNFVYWQIPNFISDETCDYLIEALDKRNHESAPVIDGEGEAVNLEIRDVKRCALPLHLGIAPAMAGAALHVNQLAWKFDINCLNQAEYLSYTEKGHYTSHTDTLLNKNLKECRKLTINLFLNDDFEGGKFYINTEQEKTYPEQAKGTLLVFPSFLLHGVEPVISGKRKNVIGWMCGPWFK